MSTKFLSPGWRMPRNANQSKFSNYSLQPPDINAKINISNPANAGITNSISFWLKRTSPTSVTQAYTINNAYGMWMNNTTLYIAYGGSILTITTTLGSIGRDALNSTDWVHWVLIREATATSGSQSFKLYANTDLIYSTNSKNFGTYNTEVSQVIRRLNNTDSMDSFSIFDYALSPSQVTTLWGGGTSVSNPMALPSPPIAYYPLGTSAWNGQYLAENNAIGDYVFDFANSNIKVDSIGDLFSGITNFSFSGWFNLTSFGSQQVFNILEGNNSKFGINTFNNQLRFNVTPGVSYIANLQNITSTNTWFHYAGVFDGSGASDTDRLKLYINGQPQTVTYNTTTPTSFPTLLSTADISIGGSLSPFNGMTGKSSNIKLWTSSLTPSEVETLYNYGSPIQTLANIPQSSNLKAWYKLDASEVYNSTTTEWEINEATADYTSSLSVKAVNGSGNQVPNIQTWGPTSAITFAGWFKINTSNADWDYLMAAPSSAGPGSPSFYFVVLSGKIYSVIKTDGNSNVSIQSTNSGYNDGKWHHIARTWDGSVSNLYIDGQNASTDQDKSTTGSINYGTVSGENNLGIGTSFVTARTSSFLGEVSNVSIWNKGLSTSEITELYNNGQPGNLSSHSATSNLTGWWTLKDASTATGGGLVDLSSNSNNANTANTDVVPGSVSTLNGLSSGMSQANLVQSDLQTVAPYSKYAMNFDAASSDYISCGNDSSLTTSALTVSCWVKCDPFTPGIGPAIISKDGQGGTNRSFGFLYVYGSFLFQNWDSAGNENRVTIAQVSNPINTDGQWHHLVATIDGTTNANGIKVYIDNVVVGQATATATGIRTSTVPFVIGGSGSTGSTYTWNGQISNVSYWDAALTSAQVTEIYNEGLPGNLNSHSAYSNLVSWWQLGENSSFASNWICADEKGTNNGESQNMGVDALTNGVGTTANGVSSGMSEGNLVGDAPYSTANALSTNMVVTSRVTGSGNTP